MLLSTRDRSNAFFRHGSGQTETISLNSMLNKLTVRISCSKLGRKNVREGWQASRDA